MKQVKIVNITGKKIMVSGNRLLPGQSTEVELTKDIKTRAGNGFFRIEEISKITKSNDSKSDEKEKIEEKKVEEKKVEEKVKKETAAMVETTGKRPKFKKNKY